jgi:hypothetical protein
MKESENDEHQGCRRREAEAEDESLLHVLTGNLLVQYIARS